MEHNGVATLVLPDIGSGLKASRRQLQRLFKVVCEDTVGEIAITYEDRSSMCYTVARGGSSHMNQNHSWSIGHDNPRDTHLVVQETHL
jgi:predicted site-specific integrase-resolvase